MASVFKVYGIDGDEPVFSSWVDVASYVDQNLF